MEEPALRPPRAADYAALATWLPDAQACLHWAGPLIPFPIQAEQFERQLAVPGGSSWVLADAGDAAVGFGQHWVREPGAVHLGRIIVAPAARGQGLGHSLCRQLMAQARAVAGVDTVTLRVFRSNLAARAVYEVLGFVPVDSASDEDVLFMQRSAA